MTLVFALSLSLLVDWDLSTVFDTFVAYEDPALLQQGNASLVQRFRFEWAMNAGRWQWDGAWEANAIVRENLAFIERPIWLRTDDLDSEIQRDDDLLLLQNLDRFSLAFENDRLGLRLGRQAVGHGSGKIFNPSDIFAPLSPFLLNNEYKAGIDGLRVTAPFGVLSESEAYFFLDRDGLALALARLGTQWRGVDLSILVGETYDEWTVAWDLAGTIGDAAWNTEGVWRSRDDRSDPVRGSTGLTHRFPGEWDLTVEFSYDSVSNRGPGSVFGLLSRPEFVHGELYLRGHWHSGLSVGHQIHPLVMITGLWIASLQDHSGWIQGGVDWDANQWSNLRAGLLVTYGNENTELGPFPDTLFLEYRVQF